MRFDLTPRQREALLTGLELLRQQAGIGRGVAAGGAPLCVSTIVELASIIRGTDAAVARHQHAVHGARERAHNVVGECSVHGTICLGCAIVWQLEDGPLDWCRECERVLAAVDEPVKMDAAQRRTGRQRTPLR